MKLDAMIEDNKLILTCGSEDDYGTIVECLHALINVVYKLKDTRETSPEGCLYKIADKDPKSLRIIIEDTSDKKDPKTGNFKGIDQILNSLPPYKLIRKDVLPCMEALGSTSSHTAAEAVKFATDLTL